MTLCASAAPVEHDASKCKSGSAFSLPGLADRPKDASLQAVQAIHLLLWRIPVLTQDESSPPFDA